MEDRRRFPQQATQKASAGAFMRHGQPASPPRRSGLPQEGWHIAGPSHAIVMDNDRAMLTPRAEGVEPEPAGSMVT